MPGKWNILVSNSVFSSVYLSSPTEALVYRRILPLVSAGLAGVNPSPGGSLLRQQTIS